MLDNSKWMKVRAEVYEKYRRIPLASSPLYLRLEPADRGWIDMYFTLSGKDYMITLSCYPEPFLHIRKWLEDMIMRTDVLDNTLFLDCDYCYENIFHYEHLTAFHRDAGLLYLYDDLEEDYLAGYVDLHNMIKVIYTGIMTYAFESERTDQFRENWLDFIQSSDYPDELLSSAFCSQIVEYFIGNANRYDTRNHFTSIDI